MEPRLRLSIQGREALAPGLSSKEPAKIDEVFVEYHRARMILELYEELSPESQRRLAETRIPAPSEFMRPL